MIKNEKIDNEIGLALRGIDNHGEEKTYQSVDESFEDDFDDDFPQDSEAAYNECEEEEEISQDDMSDGIFDSGGKTRSTCTALYLNDMSRIKPMTDEEEKECGEKLKAMRVAAAYLSDLKEKGELDMLSEDEIKAQEKIIRTGVNARERMCESVLRQSFAVAKKQYMKCSSVKCKVLLEDLIQAGNLGIMRAIDTFDPDRGVKFCTYATWWIRQRVVCTANKESSIIYIPRYMMVRVLKINEAKSKLKEKLNRQPTYRELAEETGLTVSNICEALSIGTISEHRIEDPVKDSDNSDSELGSFISDDRAESNVSTVLEQKDLKAITAKALKHLTPQQLDIVQMRYGIEPYYDKHTLEEIGQKYNLTRERVRQILASIYIKMRDNKDMKMANELYNV